MKSILNHEKGREKNSILFVLKRKKMVATMVVLIAKVSLSRRSWSLCSGMEESKNVGVM
jgi:hypothetical protein